MPSLYTEPNTVAVGTKETFPVNVDFSPFLLAGDALSSPTALLTQETGTVITPTDAPSVLRSSVAGTPAPAPSSFALSPGAGGQFLAFDPSKATGAGMILTVGAQVATVQSIVGDQIALASPLSRTPFAGDGVVSSFVQQIIRGSQLAAGQFYRLDVTAVLNASKIMVVSVGITCPY